MSGNARGIPGLFSGRCHGSFLFGFTTRQQIYIQRSTTPSVFIPQPQVIEASARRIWLRAAVPKVPKQLNSRSRAASTSYQLRKARDTSPTTITSTLHTSSQRRKESQRPEARESRIISPLLRSCERGFRHPEIPRRHSIPPLRFFSDNADKFRPEDNSKAKPSSRASPTPENPSNTSRTSKLTPGSKTGKHLIDRLPKTLAGWVGNYLTKSSGIKVVFESAIVPKWGDGVITFKNVFVSRRPGQGSGKVSKGSPTTAAAAAADTGARREGASIASAQGSILTVVEDTNYTQFNLSLDTVNVTLSFTKWFNGKGVLRDVEIKGVRGVIDRTSVHYSGEQIDPRVYKHEHNPGDFEIDSFKLQDLLVTVHQPQGFRPFSVSVFACDLPKLRRQWLFYDVLSANTMSGSFDESLFTIHPRQSHGPIGVLSGSEPDPWKKHSRLRLDGLKIDHLNRGIEGPFSWIHEGNVDIVADIMFPPDVDESIAKVMSDFYDRMEATVTANRHPLHDPSPVAGQSDDSPASVSTAMGTHNESSEDDKRFLVMDLRVHLNDVRAAVPLFTKELSYVNSALIRPIVAYINSRKTFIPINCRVVKRASEFDGSWTIFDSGLMDDLSAETYEAFAKDVVDDQARMRRFKKVGLWSLQVAVQALVMGMAGGMVA
ncbi:MAG: hypothetical protein Q9222_000108 [Ikaeria aurantiellina]